ncbi:MAG: F-type H+-transporting ATPase subunit b' [Candidatus Tokpelaia sp. JSC188]|nr:MAG: F-type H+-transporting ATPase subunit b' [Candidatus Tokpelaia sp. JSC188]
MLVSTPYSQIDKHAAIQAGSSAGSYADRVFPPFDFSFFESHVFWLFICFGFFYLFMSRVILPRIGDVIRSRHDKITADLDYATCMKQETDAVIIACEKSLSEARKRADAIVSTASDKAKAKAELERYTVQVELNNKLAEAKSHISNIRDKALRNVGVLAEVEAARIVQKLIGRSVNKAFIKKAIKDCIELRSKCGQ